MKGRMFGAISAMAAMVGAAMAGGMQLQAVDPSTPMAPNGRPWKRPTAQIGWTNKSSKRRGSNMKTKRAARKARNVARNRRSHR